MNTHLHLVLDTREPNLGQGMQRLVGGYAFWFNRRHRREGHLFTSPYYTRRIAQESHLIQACVYVVLNPVSAGICGHPGDWRWSSYGDTLGAAGAVGITDPELLLVLLAEDADVARSLYRALVDDAVAAGRGEPRGSG